MIERKNDLIESNTREIKRIDELLTRSRKPEFKSIMQMPGVKGFLSDLVIIPSQYTIAAEICAGSHMNDIVVDSFDTAIKCIKYLKENKIGTARFLPMNKINTMPKQALPNGCVGWMSELVHHDILYTGIVDFVFGRTACVSDVDKAKEIFNKQRIRIVTLDGELIEPSGVISGGYHMKFRPEFKRYVEEKKKLDEEIKLAGLEIEEYGKELAELRKKVVKTQGTGTENSMNQLRGEIEKLSDKRRELYDSKLDIQQEMNKLRIDKARSEANFENAKIQWEEYEKKFNKSLEEKGIQTLKKEEREILEKITLLGPVNMKAIDDFNSIKDEFDEFSQRVKKISDEKDMIEKSIKKIDEKKKEVLMKTMGEVSEQFRQVYRELTQGDAELNLENDDVNAGLLISASPHGKKLIFIDSMSTGEKVLTALAFLFAIQRYKPSPFYILDEVDAALDKVNTHRVIEMIRKHSAATQFIIISHNSEMVKSGDQVYGISMEEGESKIIGIKLPNN
jgi:chromosome segregation ATPase